MKNLSHNKVICFVLWVTSNHQLASVKQSIKIQIISCLFHHFVLVSLFQRSSRKKICILVIVLAVAAVIIGLIIWGAIKQWGLLLLLCLLPPSPLLHLACLVVSLDEGWSTAPPLLILLLLLFSPPPFTRGESLRLSVFLWLDYIFKIVQSSLTGPHTPSLWKHN